MDSPTPAAYRSFVSHGSSLRNLALTIALALAATLPALAATDTPIAWDEADKHVGEEATV